MLVCAALKEYGSGSQVGKSDFRKIQIVWGASGSIAKRRFRANKLGSIGASHDKVSASPTPGIVLPANCGAMDGSSPAVVVTVE
jgi:hypothetical protein